MTHEAKGTCYTDIYQNLKENPDVKNLSFPKDRKNYDFNCMIGPVSITFSLNSNQDRCMIRGVVSFEGKLDAQITEFLKGLTRDETNIDGFGGGKNGIISTSILLTDLTDEKASEKLMNEAESFFSFLIEKKEQIEQFQNGPFKEMAPSSKSEPEEENPIVEEKSRHTAPKEESVKKEMDEKKPPKARRERKSNLNRILSSVAGAANIEKVESGKKTVDSPRSKEVRDPSGSLAKEKNIDSFEKEKVEFRQYCKDQEHLLSIEKEELAKKKEELAALKRDVDSEKQAISLKEAELEQKEKEFYQSKEEFQKQKKEFNGQVLGLNKEKEELRAEKNKWDNTTMDEKLIQRRKELENLENNLYQKEEAFQKFQDDTLNDISARLDTVAEKEKEMIKKEESFQKREDDLKSLEGEIDLRYKKLQEKERAIAKKESELSELEASLRRTEIIKHDAENERKQLEIQRKNFEIQKEQQALKEKAFQKRESAFTEKYQKVMLDIASMENKKKSLEEKEADVRSLIGENEALEAQLKELKIDTAKTTNILNEKDDVIAKKDAFIDKQKKRLKAAEEKLSQEQKKNTSISGENQTLKKRTEKAEAQVKELETEVARVRTELYDKNEELKNKAPVEKQQQKDSPETLLRIKELQKLKKEAEAENSILKNNLDEMTERCQQYEDKIKTIESNSEKEISDWQNQLTKAEEKITELEEMQSQDTESKEFDPSSIGAKIVVGEREGLYALNVDDCAIYIDTQSHTVQVKKEVRRPARYVNKITQLNQETMTETYFPTKTAVNCRKSYDTDVMEEIQGILEVFSDMN